MEHVGKKLGAGPPAGTLQITLFVPTVDREGRLLDTGDREYYWREEALKVFGKLFRGATAFPPGRGVWRDDERGGELVFEDTILVTSYIDPNMLTDAALKTLREFLHRLGRETNQGEVGIVVGGMDNVVYKNKISNNNLGIRIHGVNQEKDNTTISTNARIICNNFLNNDRDAYFKYYHCFPRGSGNIIDKNFWGRSRIFARPIFGELCCPFGIFDNPFFYIPWITFDWHPAKEPYDIGVLDE